ncbi:MAG: AAA family ATPase [Coprobacillaceae bacterium]
MNIYLRNVDKQCIDKQISITKEVLNDFFYGRTDGETVEMKGKTSGTTEEVSFLLSTDPRLGGGIKTIIKAEGGMIENNILLFTKGKSNYIIDVIKPGDTRYDTFRALLDSERHLTVNVDVIEDQETNEIENIEENNEEIKYVTGLKSDFSRNRILFGAPGTGKSFKLNEDKDTLLGKGSNDFERVTFHPDYSYAHFVGTYKPVPTKDDKGNDIITYKYVPGPFMRTLVKALESGRTNNPSPFLLVIEEINRASVAAVFGEVFQLLDRNSENVSEYDIQASEDVKKYLSDELKCDIKEFDKIKMPDNMFIWATMNSADQGVFPMDTAFKRRWDFTYIGINNNEIKVKDKKFIIGKGANAHEIDWNELRKSINNELLTYKVNEDKLMGPYFISKNILESGNNKDFVDTFKNKVIMYLFDDAAKPKRSDLFSGCDKENFIYSAICEEFDKFGVSIFNSNITSRIINDPSEE